MKPHDDNADLDPSERQSLKTTAPDAGELGRTFEFRGIQLQPYSHVHTMAFWRLLCAGALTKIEHAVTLLYLLTLDARTVNAVRGDEAENNLRFDAIEWAGKLGMGRGTFNTEAIAKAEEIEADLRQAMSVEPQSSVGGRSPNA